MTHTDPLAGTRVLIVDDQRMFVDALTRIVEDAGMVVHAVAGSIAALEHSLGSPGPDFLLLDYRLPDGDALQVLPAVTRAWPGTAVIVITGYASTYTVNGALAAGAASVVSKSQAADHILDAMRAAAAPTAVDTDRRRNPEIATPAGSLTNREIEVLGLIAEGANAAAIAARLGIAATTTRNHTQSILRKLDASSQLDAVVKATKLGLVNIVGTPPPDGGSPTPV